jgi:eukaryotic-like serine/threonine-protein kinase
VSAPEFATGDVVDGKYTIQALLHHGGALATYRAVTGLNQHVALKFYDARLESFPDVVNALARCETPINELPGDLVVHIVDGGKDPRTGALYTATEFDPDSSLAELVEWSPLAASEMITFVQNLGRVLDAVHAHGIAHLSLKPTNLFVGSGPTYNVRVVDFATSLVRCALLSRQVCGASTQWLAPEQINHAGNGGPAADVFASALIAFYALTGRSYWRSVQSDSLDDAALQREMAGRRALVSQRARELSVSLDSALDPVFKRALAISPEDRFRTVGLFAEALAMAIQADVLTTSNVATVSTGADPIAESLVSTDLGEPAPTSTSAVVLAPAQAHEASAVTSAVTAPIDVPPPPAQMAAVLAAFETAVPEQLPIVDKTAAASRTEQLGVQVPTGSAAAAARKWSRTFSIAAVAAGVLVAVGIVWGISSSTPRAGELAQAASSAPTLPAANSVPEAPPSAIAPSDDALPSSKGTAAMESRTRAPIAKPVPKKVRSHAPAQPRSASPPPRKQCPKSEPCK